MNVCSIGGCTNKIEARGWCKKHWQRWWKHGDPIALVQDRDFCRALREKYHLKNIRNLPEHRVWSCMKQRCENPRNTYFKYYGSRRIKVCKEWHFFRAFYEDMGPRPSASHQLDRIDNDGNYEPANCRWTTATINNRNKPNVILSMEKATKIRTDYKKGISIAALSEQYGVTKRMIYSVVNNKKWVA